MHQQSTQSSASLISNFHSFTPFSRILLPTSLYLDIDKIHRYLSSYQQTKKNPRKILRKLLTYYTLRRRKYSLTNVVDLTSIKLRYFSIDHFLPSSYGAKLPMDRVHSVYLSVPLEPCNKELKFATAEAKNRWDSNTQTLERILQY